MNYQHWAGLTDGRFGYGSMVNGFLDNPPATIRLNEKASTAVYMGVPWATKGFLEGQWKANFTMWETDELHHRFRAWIPQYDQIIVPCEHNLELFSRHHNNVTYVPLGVDGGKWRPIKTEPNPRFRIHGGGSLWKRKGLDILVEACRLLKFDHELHIKLAPHARDNPPLNTMPEVRFHREWMSEDEQLTFFNQADLWVCPSRGEGFGLIPLQAIACGKPTIITATSGQAQFAHHALDVLPHFKRPSGGPGNWDESDPRALAEMITYHYNHLDAARKTAAKKRDAAVTEFSWKKAGEKLAAAVPGGKLLRGAKFQPLVCRVGFTVNRRTEASVNGRERKFVPGVRYDDSEGMFEVLWHAGHIQEGPL
jgi:glycosyltransferase involved in cell wall biosynthesis